MQKLVVTNASCENEAVYRHIQASARHHLSLHLMSIPDIHGLRPPHLTHPGTGLQVTIAHINAILQQNNLYWQ